MWSNLPESRRSPRPRFQLDWESEVVEYVTFIWEKTRARKKGTAPAKLNPEAPLLGPRFIPPEYLHLQKRPGTSFDLSPETQYLKPVNIVHPFYYPGLACCPQCQSRTDVNWDGWTGTGARELHGILQDEVALGLQLRCNKCRGGNTSSAAGDGRLDSEKVDDRGKGKDAPSQRAAQIKKTPSSGYCCATTSAAYWKTWEHWNIPCTL